MFHGPVISSILGWNLGFTFTMASQGHLAALTLPHSTGPQSVSRMFPPKSRTLDSTSFIAENSVSWELLS